MSQPYLEIISPDGRRQFPLGDQPVTIGRHGKNLLVLTDDLASRYHCVIEPTPEGWRLRDLGSSNGTRVNGMQVKSVMLKGGDLVTVGRTGLKLVAGRPVPVAAPVVDDDIEVVEVDADDDDNVGFGDDFISGDEVVEIPDEMIEVEVEIDPDDYEGRLVHTVNSLPDGKFDDGQIVLMNARGQVSHAAETPAAKKKDKKKQADEPRDAVDILRLILLICFRTRASDIHVEPKQDDYQVRIRVDGTMVDIVRLPKDMGVRLTSLVKILSDIDISQRNTIQEGHFSTKIPGRRVDYRISFAPSMYGQKLVVRILDAANAPYHVWDLHLPEWMYETIMQAMGQDSGMFLTCGPTGSGKTSTLYAVIRDIDVNERNVVTIEDPVEIELAGVTQIPVNESQGNSFSNLLRSVLRQDPDAILVGEVRDPETAKIALQAAVTGHLVFSTVHSRDTLGCIFRLIDLGVEPYLVANGLQLILAQRLVRQLCPNCKTPVKPSAEQLSKMGRLGEGVTKIYQPKGCPRCVGTGFFGRRGIFELLKTTDALRDLILRNPSAIEMQKILAEQKNFMKLQDSGYQLVAEGVTSLDEVEKSL